MIYLIFAIPAIGFVVCLLVSVQLLRKRFWLEYRYGDKLLDQYLYLESLMVECDDNDDEENAEWIRDRMDIIWPELTKKELEFLNSRSPLSVVYEPSMPIKIRQDLRNGVSVSTTISYLKEDQERRTKELNRAAKKAARRNKP